uniref:Reverse transcriptase domain-containing protein n=1 Tax=Tanacetum cinerariifolium TaxID=118510 RepID=A0A699IAJ0_TANCI|nr:hypothetical protein [Tanacetum cinerariifolium]
MASVQISSDPAPECQTMALERDSLSPGRNCQENVSYGDKTEKDERVEETLTDQDLAEYTIKVPPALVQKPKPLSQKNLVVHQRDPLHPNIPYPSRMLKQKQQENDEVQIHKF